MSETDWLKIWSDLTQANVRPENNSLQQRYQAHTEKKHNRPDPLLDFIISLIKPEYTILEIGPGNGRWTIPLALVARQVTAVEPSAEMRTLLQEKILSEGLVNISVLPEQWETAQPVRHDLCICAHGMYNSPDLALFVRKMESCASRLCALAVRIPPPDGIMAELSGKIYGLRHDSPNAVIAFNALYSIGIHANFLVEETMLHWQNRSLEEACARAKRHLRVENKVQYDLLIENTLRKRLLFKDGVYIWPDGMKSALLYWRPLLLSGK